MKKKKILKVAAAVATLGVVAAISFSATFAYLTALTPQKTNTFTSQGVNISVDEGSWDFNAEHKYVPGQSFDKAPQVDVDGASESAYIAAVLTYWKGITQKEYNDATTNGSVTVDGYVKVGSGSDAKYYERIAPSDFDNIAKTYYDGTHEINPAWEVNTEHADTYLTYYYKADLNSGELQVVGPETGTAPLFNKVIFNNLEAKTLPAPGVSTTLSDIKIIVSAYAVRASTYVDDFGAPDFEDAKDELNRLIAGNINSVKPTS